MIALALSTSIIRPLFSLDAAAVSYIAAVTIAKGSAPTSTQQTAINNFIVAEKAASRWTGHKRIYFPIWANAAANAIDLKTLATGTYPNGATHDAGYVVGNGTSQYFDTGVTHSGAGLTASSGYMFVLQRNHPSVNFSAPIGAGATYPTDFYVQTTPQFVARYSAGDTVTGAGSSAGIVSAARFSGTRKLFRRTTAARALMASTTGADSAGLGGGNIFAMANNVSDAGSVPSGWCDSQFGAFGFGMGLSDADDAAVTSNLKTLWETCTGLTLP